MTQADLTSLVDWEHGLISPEIFISDEIYQRELELLFGRAWLFLAHDSMIPNPGDFFSTYMGGDPVIVSRQKDGTVKAFLNVCRHRGMKVCRAEEGNSNAFMCTYHGWTYDGSGALVSVPNFEDAYYGELEMAKWGLVPVAQVDSYRGLIFGTFDAAAPPLLDYLGGLRFYFDGWLDHAAGGIEVLPGTIKWTIHGNWKMAAEQFAGDGYHAQVTHTSSLGQFGPSGLFDQRLGRQFSSRLGHGHSFIFNRMTRFADDPLGHYNEEKLATALERVGPERAGTVGNFTAFPNFSGLPGSANIRVWHPKGPNKFEIWSWTVVEKDAPPEVKRAQQVSSTFTEGAAGTVEIDDGENWDLIGQLLEHGAQARRYPWHYQMGLGHERRDDASYPGLIMPTYFGEGPQRAFYRRWLEFMTSERWPAVDDAELAAELRALSAKS
jgi:3-phenylpropionate/trans-cinnamate dioxygenase alpha subunit